MKIASEWTKATANFFEDTDIKTLSQVLGIKSLLSRKKILLFLRVPSIISF